MDLRVKKLIAESERMVAARVWINLMLQTLNQGSVDNRVKCSLGKGMEMVETVYLGTVMCNHGNKEGEAREKIVRKKTDKNTVMASRRSKQQILKTYRIKA